MRRRIDPMIPALLVATLVACLACDHLVRPAERVVPDLAACELADVPVGGHFRHDGELWVRLAPDPDRTDGRPVCLAARLTGPGEALGVPRRVFARCWVRPVAVDVTRAREPWEDDR